MKRRLVSLVCLLVLIVGVLAPVGVALAAYDYYFPIRVHNNSTTVYDDGLPVLVSINNSQLYSLGYIDADGLDTAVQEGGTDRDFMVQSSYLGVFFPSVADGQVRNVNYRLGETPGQSSFPLITGVGGNVTIDDVDALELGNNFTIEIDGYFDTSAGSDKNILYKRNGIAIYVSDSEKITAAFITDTTDIEYLLPEGTGTYSQINGVNDWQAVDDPVATPDDAATKISNDTSSYLLDTFVMSNSTLASDTLVNSVTVYTRIASDGGTNLAYAKPVLLLDAVQVTGAATIGTGSTWTTYSETLSKPGGGAWTVANLNDLEVGLYLREAGGAANAYCTQNYAAVEYVTGFSNDVEVAAINVASGEHNVVVSADGTNLEISVDGAVAGDGYDTIALGGTSVPANGNDWLLNQNDVMLYMNYYYHTVGVTRYVRYEPVTMISGTVLTDREGGDHNGAISWGSNPAGIDITIGALTSAVATTAGVGTDEEAPDLLSPVPTFEYIPDPEEAELVGMPLYASVANAADKLGMSTTVAYVVLMWMTCMALGVAAFVALGSSWGFVGGYGFGSALALGTPVWPQMLVITGLFIVVLGVFLWRRY